VRLRLWTAIAATIATALSAAPASLADTGLSTNWAGYAAHASGMTYTAVSAVWHQPAAKCARPNQTYSAMWVGIGGYSESSQALEQIGTEADCKASGKQAASAWYELVPAPSHPIRMKIHDGDLMAASVVLGTGDTVTLTLEDTTTKAVFHRTYTTSVIDNTSAEWILEAPSECIGPNACETLPLANFQHATFGLATATDTAGHTGAIDDPAWGDTEITLAPHGRRYVGYRSHTTVAGGATPGPLDTTGTTFTVAFHHVTAETNPFLLATDRAYGPASHGLFSF
jgi:hypothetical protein